MSLLNNEHIQDSDLLDLIAEQITYYQLGKMTFPPVVSSLYSYISALSESCKPISDTLRIKWSVLEEINALALDEGKEMPLADHNNLAEETFNEILSLIGRDNFNKS